MKEALWIATLSAGVLVGGGCARDAVPNDGSAVAEAPVVEVAAETAPLTEAEHETWFVAGRGSMCHVNGAISCLMIQRPLAAEQERFYGRIGGFSAEPDMEYELVVAVHSDEDSSADRPAPRFELVEIVRATQAEPWQPASSRVCASAADCEPDEMCTGAQGCDTEWTCQPSRPCTKDLRPYCACDGTTVFGSGSCPPTPFQHRGACE